MALLYESIQGARAAAVPSGTAVYQVGLAHHATRYFAFFCLVLLAPLALAMTAIGRRFGLTRTGLEWYVLGLYSYGMGAALQLVLHLAALAMPEAGQSGAMLWIEFAIPPALFTWGTTAMVERGRRTVAVLTSIAAHAAVLALLVAGQLLLGE